MESTSNEDRIVNLLEEMEEALQKFKERSSNKQSHESFREWCASAKALGDAVYSIAKPVGIIVGIGVSLGFLKKK